jgi:ribosome-binding factor A
MSIRVNRVEDVLLRALSDVVRDKVRDPRIGFVTVMSVSVTPDIRNAKVYVSVIGNEKEKSDTLKGLKASAPFIRREVAHQVMLKAMPELTFIYDESPERGERMMNLFKDIESDTKLG